MKTFLLYLCFFVSFPLISLSQEHDTIISANRQFDFWIGKWDVYTNDELVGKNTIQLLQNGNILQENWISEKENFTGTSYSFYNPKIKQWQQVWIDNSGSNLLLKGNFSNGRMILISDLDSNMGEPESIHRITWSAMPNGDVKQVWESTVDQGKNWNLQFEGIYKKITDE
ncbi:hypothetical protein [Ancylomarina longa]|uniref:DUF1579 domain-containing protein n=1 Tax=Ancylomarina longa TaxID=2487017 RepID=A0A434AF75_9BACT|nr:hypothetical protein [Ancylomarina longa]RUT73020.1 hypothetical protein DLK05_15465 [Ancylomarina longa]